MFNVSGNCVSHSKLAWKEGYVAQSVPVETMTRLGIVNDISPWSPISFGSSYLYVACIIFTCKATLLNIIFLCLVEQRNTAACIEIIGQIPSTVSKPSTEKMLRNEVHLHSLLLESILQAHGIGYRQQVAQCSTEDSVDQYM